MISVGLLACLVVSDYHNSTCLVMFVIWQVEYGWTGCVSYGLFQTWIGSTENGVVHYAKNEGDRLGKCRIRDILVCLENLIAID